MENEFIRLPTINKFEVLVNKDKVHEAMEKRGLGFSTLHDNLIKEYGLDISYKGFMSLMGNKSAWKLTYAWMICDFLKKDYSELFEVVEVDIEERMKEKIEWRKKYQKSK